jgi:peptide deformylase
VALHEPAGIILNPVIVRASDATVPSKEGCMTYPDKEHLVRDRYKAIEVEYQVFKGKKMERKRKLVTGFLAIVYQHEIDHLNGVYCYDTRTEEESL